MSVNLSSLPKLGWRFLGRPLVALIVAYAIAIHVLAAGALDIQLAAGDGELGQAVSFQAFALCTHQSQDDPAAPGSPADPRCIQHCFLCLTDLKLAPLEPDGSAIKTPELKSAFVPWPARDGWRQEFSHFALAQPRGPPRDA